MNCLKLPVIALLFFTAALNGCSKEQTPLRVGLLVWPAYELPFLARDMGLYRKKPIQLVDYYSPAEVLRAYTSGGLDAIAVTIDYALQIAVDDPDQRIILVIDASYGADALLTRPELNALKDLRGKRVGIERSILGAFMLKRVLDHAGLDKNDIIISSVDLPETVAAYRESKLDAVVTYEPYRTQIKALGARELFSSRDIPGEIIDVLITRRETLQRHEGVFEVLINGWLRAAKELQEKPLDAAKIMSSREGITPEDFLQALDDMQIMTYQDNHAMLTGTAPAIESALRSQFKVMREELMIASEPAFKEMIDGRFFTAP